MNDPSFIRPEVSEMQAKAGVCNDLISGTLAMRKGGRKYLPQEPKETDLAWSIRLNRTTLFPAYQDAVDSIVGKPFGEPIIFENLNSTIESALENADLTGRDIDTFAREWFRQSLIDGIGWVLVDYPRVPQGATLADERELGARPYLVHIPLSKVCGWKAEIIGGKHKVVQFRWREHFEEPDGEFGVKVSERIKVWEPGEVRVYKQNGGAWELVTEESGPVTLKEVPLVCFAPGRTGFYTADPPLEELAWLNVTHWQSSSDQRHVLHVARVPLLAADKMPETADGTSVIEAGPNALIIGAENLHYVEHSGAAIEAGRQDLLDLKEEMRLISGKILSRQAGGDKSASEAALEAKDGNAKLRQWVWTFQDCLEEALRLMSQWIGAGDNGGGSATIATDWDDVPDPTQLPTVLQSRLSGELSRKTWLWNAQRYGILPNGISIEQETAAIESEGPVNFGSETGM